MSRVAAPVADAVKWYTLEDRLMPGKLVGTIDEYPFVGERITVATDYAAVTFPENVEDADAATKHFIGYCETLKEDEVSKKIIHGISLRHVELSERTLDALALVTPIGYLDLRGHTIEPKELIDIYQIVGSHCQIVVDQSNKLLTKTSDQEHAPWTRFAVPINSLEGVSIADFMYFLHRIHLQDEAGMHNWSDYMTDLDLSHSYANMDKFVDGGHDLLPKNVKKLTVDHIYSAYFTKSILSQMSRVEDLSMRDCDFVIEDGNEALVYNKALKRFDCTGSKITFPAYMQMVVRLPGSDQLVLDKASDVSPAEDLTKTALAKMKKFALKYADLIRPESQVRGAEESKCDDAPTEEPMVSGQVVMAINDYLQLAEDHLVGSRHLTGEQVQRNNKRWCSVSHHFYRDVPAAPFVQVYADVMFDLIALFNQEFKVNGEEKGALVEHLQSARWLLKSSAIEKRAEGVPTLFEGAISVRRLKSLLATMGQEIKFVQNACVYYSDSTKYSAAAKLEYVDQVLGGVYLVTGAVLSLLARAKEAEHSDSTLVEFTAEDAQAMVAYYQRMLAEDKALEAAEDTTDALPDVPEPAAVLAASVGMFASQKSRASEAKPDVEKGLAYDVSPLVDVDENGYGLLSTPPSSP
ncbi:MAG: hypothetical protein P1U63_11775 [Coxiellaceae bacterium]|nr:hypothetical protein [Coxiellaceae bacterium]